MFSDVRYLDALAPTRAGAIIISRKLGRHAAASNRLIYVDNPRRAYAQVGRLFYPPQALQPASTAARSCIPAPASDRDRRSTPAP